MILLNKSIILFLFVVLCFACRNNGQKDVEYIPDSLRKKGIYWGLSKDKIKEIMKSNNISGDVYDSYSSSDLYDPYKGKVCKEKMEVVCFMTHDTIFGDVYEVDNVIYFCNSVFSMFTLSIHENKHKSNFHVLYDDIVKLHECAPSNGVSSSNIKCSSEYKSKKFHINSYWLDTVHGKEINLMVKNLIYQPYICP